MELEEIIPKKPEFYLSSSNKTYCLRHPSIEDMVIFKGKFGVTAMQEALKKTDWSIISVLVMQLMIDKSDFLPLEIEEEDFNGEKTKKKIFAPERLRRAVSQMQDQMNVIEALTEAIVGGDPILKKAVDEEIKKSLKTRENEKESQSAGPQSLTSSQASTDGLLNTSEAAP